MTARHASLNRPRGGVVLPVEPLVTLCAMLATVALLAVSSTLLTARGIHYLTSGGPFYEKLHPATYFVVLACMLMAFRRTSAVAGFLVLFSQSRPLLLFLLCWVLLLAHVILLGRPFTVVIDTFLLPALICVVVWQLSASQRALLVSGFHAFILLNVALGYFEYFSGTPLIPLTVGDLQVMGEWRSSALLGHPLTASGLVGAYVIALALRPALCPPPMLRLGLILFSLGSLMVFGGRTALVTVLLILTAAGAVKFIRLLRGERVSLLAVIATLFIGLALAVGVAAVLEMGLFDKMLLRFSSDKGSALARLATFRFLSGFSFGELMFGPSPARAGALQAQMGLTYGIENFWISSIVQFGIVHTIVLTIGLAALFFELLRRSHRAAFAVMLLILAIAASSVSFSSKNIQLAQFVLLIALLLPRDRPERAARFHPAEARRRE